MTKHFEEKDWIQVSDGFKFEVEMQEHDKKPIIQTYQTDGNTFRHMTVPTIIVENIIRLEVNRPFNGYVVVIFDKE
ncbi:hypothetical protein [Chryseobacterium taichungense]|uniref:Uncharacterized protein n=1 Tax=Chryseobacterium taichungense TaxID=295069 RepID=A0A1H7W1I0_9FLAO|nr:hypothetical protein [Chryseobacterium taichungense]SEM15366.1 hypothetical protein SAMN05421856_101427 [Chryseobacterium taichungense]